MLTDEELDRYKKLISRIERERDEATGALKQIQQSLKKEFNVSLKDAAKLLKKLEKEYADSERKFIKDFNRFVGQNRKYLKKLDGIDPKSLRAIPLPENPVKTTPAEKERADSRDQESD